MSVIYEYLHNKTLQQFKNYSWIFDILADIVYHNSSLL